ncbi:MAG: magnesium transporter CorA family protein [Candidatus Moraniibacteriota bacterium]
MRTLTHKRLTWIDFESPTKDDVAYLHENFDIHPIVLEELITPTYQPRVLQYDQCIFFSIHIPLFDVKERTTYAGELDIILTRDHLITAHRYPIYQIGKFFGELEQSEGKRRLYLEDSPSHLIYRLLEILLNSCFPKLRHVSEKIDRIEMEVFAGHEKEMVFEISLVKRDILNFRRTLKPQRSLIESLLATKHPIIPTDLHVYFQDLIGTNIRLWNMLESNKETIEALEATNNSLLSNKLEQTMKVLTIFSAVILPLTVYSNAMSMNTRHLPFENYPGGFWWHLSTMIFISAITIVIFRLKRWI